MIHPILDAELSGWKEIAEAVGRGVTWCKDAASKDNENRLPVWWIGRIPTTTRRQLDQWRAEEGKRWPSSSKPLPFHVCR